MKLYYATGACSLADKIALIEAGVAFEQERVDLKAKRTETGADFLAINPKGYVPVLVLDNGDTVTENVAVLELIASKHPELGVDGAMGRTRLLEALAYLGTEVHVAFKPFFHGTDEQKADAKTKVLQKLEFLSGRLRGDYLFGDRPTVADCYLFVMLLWAEKAGITVPAPLAGLRERMLMRPAVQKAIASEAPRKAA